MSLNPLKSILKEMNEIYEALLAVGKEKQEALIRGDHELLLSIFPKENRLVKKISVLEDQRQQQSLAFNNLSLTDIISNSSFAADRDELLHYQSELISNLNLLEKQHNVNQQLTASALTYINNMLALVTQQKEQPASYTAKNSLLASEHNYSKGFFDAKI